MIRRVGSYEILDAVGQGGMGAVYRARHAELGAMRAVKLMARPDNPKSVARFQRETENLARVSHPNVVRIHECGHVSGQPYFIMDFVEGQGLDSLLERGPLPWREAVKMAVAIARGVGALHEVGIVHRDLKPANVMLTKNGTPVVIDLGLAVAPETDQRLTKTGALMGTLSYMAPEQFDGKGISPRTDVYALGLILYELLTGRPAIPEESSIQTTTAFILMGKRPRPSANDRELPAKLDTIALRAMGRHAEDRFADPASLAEALDDVLRHPGPSRRAYVQRRLTLSVAVGMIVAWGLGALVLTGVFDPAPGATPSPTVSAQPTLSARPTFVPPGAERDFERVDAEQDPKLKYERASQWLARYAGHARRREVEEAQREAQLAFPLREIALDDLTAAAWVGAHLATGGRDRTVRLWDPETGDEVHRWSVAWAVTALASGHDGGSIFVGGERGNLSWFLVETREQIFAREGAVKGGAVRAITSEPAGKWVAVAGRKFAEVLMLPTFSEVHYVEDHDAPVWTVALSPDGKRLATGSGLGIQERLELSGAGPGDQSVRIWRLGGRKRAKQIGMARFDGKVQDVVFDPGQGEWIAVGTSAGRIFLIDAHSGMRLDELHGVNASMTPLDSTTPAHSGPVRALCVSERTRRLHSVSDGGKVVNHEIRVWDPRARKELHQVVRRPRPFSGVDVSPNGKRLLVWTGGHGLEIWALP